MSESIVAIVPVKALEAAKSRLAPRLTLEARAGLVLDLLAHTVATVRESGVFRHCIVVSADPSVHDRATTAGAIISDEGGSVQIGQHNAALEFARRDIQRFHPEGLLVLSADLPLLAATDLRAMVELGADGNTVVLAPDRAGTGTNAMFLRPANAIPFLFGVGSYQRHRRAAEQCGLAVRRYVSPGTAFDVDCPEDLDDPQFRTLDRLRQLDSNMPRTPAPSDQLSSTLDRG